MNLDHWQFLTNTSSPYDLNIDLNVETISCTPQQHSNPQGETRQVTDSDLVVAPLVDQGVLSVTGEDAETFLQGQITCDINTVSEHKLQWGACCNPKGRVLFSFWLHKINTQHYLLQMPIQLVDSAHAHLTKYAVFFKATIANSSHAYCLFGGNNLTPSKASDYVTALDDRLDLAIVSVDTAADYWQQCLVNRSPLGSEWWQRQQVTSGWGHVTLKTTEMFIPQMLNLQALDGISFKKGCYTGQEVVARMKYLGKLKRRMYLLSITGADHLLAPGTTCHQADNDQSVGNIVASAWTQQPPIPAENQHTKQLCLAVLTDNAAHSEQLIFGNNSEPKADTQNNQTPALPIKLLPLPYADQL